MKINTRKVIDLSEWDKVVEETYGRPYCLQQQNGCVGRGMVQLTVPNESNDYERNEISEFGKIEMGVSFAAWLKRDPKTPLKEQEHDFENKLWWERNFYPELQMVANDLCSKGLLPPGDYFINIDW